uniref:protein CASC3 isoform X2 n=1 Tax=Ciona intestinalis TaxID=7719 RepID=UPI00089DADCE|nr:protein CASC3 isoform X2 [Ciona intestinalis]|eukprot:XP_018671992.1 protein CASC3 isoform X2 [Ciona intestinalis]
MPGIRRRRRDDNDVIVSEGESQSQALSASQSVHSDNDDFTELSSEYESGDEEVDQSDASVPKSPSLKSVERGSGDGKEQSDIEQDGIAPPSDKDEPSFIPTKGVFYQHDVRSSRDSHSSRGYKTKPDTTRWLHDKFNEAEQTPKTRAQLVEEYGYDIRSYKYGEAPNIKRNQRSNQEPKFIHEKKFPRQRERNGNYEKGGRATNLIKTQDFHSKRRQFIKPETRTAQQMDRAEKPQPEPNLSLTLNKSENSGKDGLTQVLDVINQRENKRPHNDKVDNLSNRMQNLTMKREFNQPRRYSSLRQRTTESPRGEAPKSGHVTGANFSNPEHSTQSNLPMPAPDWLLERPGKTETPSGSYGGTQNQAYQQWQQMNQFPNIAQQHAPLLPPMATEQTSFEGNPQQHIDLNQSRGTAGSMNFSANYQHNSYVQRLPDRALPLPPPQIPMLPGLLGQQVGGVTYYTPAPNSPIGSPLRRPTAAIPIRHPM